MLNHKRINEYVTMSIIRKGKPIDIGKPTIHTRPLNEFQVHPNMLGQCHKQMPSEWSYLQHLGSFDVEATMVSW